MALRGNDRTPARPVPAVYRSLIGAIQSGIGGPGPLPAGELVIDELAFADARVFLRRLQADHDRLTPKNRVDVYDLAETAIDRAKINFAGGPDAFDGGATQLDQGQILVSIWSSADDELKAARRAGYQIPKDLAELPSEAQAQLEAAKSTWVRAAPRSDRLTTPTDEIDLLGFSRHATSVIGSMRSRRAADIARARRREAEALEAAADRQMAELARLIAEKRRAAFRAGDKDALDKIHDALGQVVGAINDTKAAAAIITDRVDQLNAVAKALSAKGAPLIDLPAVPSQISGVAKRLGDAHSKLGTVIKLLDLAKPGKTKLDEGLKYLQGIDMALEGFASKTANPFIAVYINGYLGPGIRNCIQSIGKISDIISTQNRSLIEHGQARLIANWNTEPGGQAAYLFLAQVYRSGGAAAISDDAWEYFRDHRADLSAAVGNEMPTNRRLVGPWASRNRHALWQAFYGATKPPG
jgi:hypothetical protein